MPKERKRREITLISLCEYKSVDHHIQEKPTKGKRDKYNDKSQRDRKVFLSASHC
jgi:hypothetical protein